MFVKENIMYIKQTLIVWYEKIYNTLSNIMCIKQSLYVDYANLKCFYIKVYNTLSNNAHGDGGYARVRGAA